MSTPAARNSGAQSVSILRKRITYSSNGTTITVGRIPSGASVIGGGVHIVTGFDDTGTDTLIVGFIGSTTDDNAYATLLDLTSVGFIALDELTTTTNIQQTVDTSVTCKYVGQNSNATAGTADVIIQFVNNNDG